MRKNIKTESIHEVKFVFWQLKTAYGKFSPPQYAKRPPRLSRRTLDGQSHFNLSTSSWTSHDRAEVSQWAPAGRRYVKISRRPCPDTNRGNTVIEFVTTLGLYFCLRTPHPGYIGLLNRPPILTQAEPPNKDWFVPPLPTIEYLSIKSHSKNPNNHNWRALFDAFS